MGSDIDITPLVPSPHRPDSPEFMKDCIAQLCAADSRQRENAARVIGLLAYAKIATAEAAIPALFDALGDDDIKVIHCAAKVLLLFRKDFTSNLIEIFKEDKRGEGASEMLGYIGAPAVPALVRELNSADTQLRRYCADVFGRMGKYRSLGAEKENALQALASLLQDPDEMIRFIAATSIINISPSPIVVPIFNAVLMQDEVLPGAKVGAAISLAKLGAAAAPAAPGLIQALKSNDVELRLQTSFAFQSIGLAGKEALSALQDAAAHDPDERVRKAAFYAAKCVSGKYVNINGDIDADSKSLL